MSVTAALALPSIAFVGQVINGRNVEAPVQRTKVDPQPERRVGEPAGSREASTLDEERKPSRTSKPSPSGTPKVEGTNQITERSAVNERRYVGKHRGKPAPESLSDLLALAHLPKGEQRRVRVTVPGLGSSRPFVVQVDRGRGVHSRGCQEGPLPERGWND
jgi:hypothetical protein